MTGAAPAPAADLVLGFEAFVEASRRLEASYSALKARADAVDLQLEATNRALQQALEEKEAILGALPAGVLAIAADGRQLWSNPEAGRLLEAARCHGVDLIGCTVGEHEIGPMTLAVQRVPLPGGDRLLVVEDRSTVVRLTREVDRLDRMAGLSELALGIAHEIKNPLNGVMGFAELLAGSDSPDAMRRYAAAIVRGLRQVDDIVREMLAFARSPEKAAAPVPIGDLVAEAAAAAGVPRSCVELAGCSEARVGCAPLVRVLGNLFRNSAEASDGALTITVEVVEAGERLVLEVGDRGPGISAELGEHVFRPFVSTKGRGSGLGLALASRVMDFLGGALRLLPSESGARFRLELPAAAGQEAVGDG